MSFMKKEKRAQKNNSRLFCSHLIQNEVTLTRTSILTLF
jgi:hypothetical protein